MMTATGRKRNLLNLYENGGFMSVKFSLLFVLMSSLAVGNAFAKNDKEKSKPLPPGLAKNQMRGKPLPPGWQMKLAKGQVLDQRVVDAGSVVVPLTKEGWLTIRVEGKLIKLMEKTREIVEILE